MYSNCSVTCSLVVCTYSKMGQLLFGSQWAAWKSARCSSLYNSLLTKGRMAMHRKHGPNKKVAQNTDLFSLEVWYFKSDVTTGKYKLN